jgi:hypothetical protein
MDGELTHLDETPAAEHDLDVWNPWNIPRAAAVPTPSLDEWPERETRFEEGVAGMDGKPAA